MTRRQTTCIKNRSKEMDVITFRHLFLAAFLLFLVTLGTAQDPPRTCIETGLMCINDCVDIPDGDYQWCGDCNWFVQCSQEITYFQPCPGDLFYNDNVKGCVTVSDTCTECIIYPGDTWSSTPPPTPPAEALCGSTGPDCIPECGITHNGVYQWCSRCDYFLLCSGSEEYYMACQPGLLYDHTVEACIFETTTCFDRPCYEDLAVTTVGDHCGNSLCLNGATCHQEDGGYFCECHKGYTGQFCEYIIDNCASSPCLNGGTCQNYLNSTYTCECPPQSTGERCELQDPCDFYTGATTISAGTSTVGSLIDNPCLDRPCHNGATCVENCTTFTCICPAGFTGHICDVEINECETIPCYPFGDCEDLIGGYNCSCNLGYETIPDNDTMCIETDFCANEDQPCYNDGTCVNQNALSRYYCICPVFDDKQYVGLKCETELITEPKVNNGGISPTSGIIAGGANVTVRGQEMDLFEPLGAYLIDTTSSPLHSQYAFVIPNMTQSDSITVQIPPVGGDYINRSLLVIVEYSGPINVTSKTDDLRFKYTGNPVIHAIEPTDILVTGGVRLTVYGSNMDSAQNPLMDITTYVVNTTGHRETNFSRQSCLEKNESAITFLVPYGIVPPSFINNTATAGKSLRGVFHLDSSFRPKKGRRTKRAPVGNLTDESGNTFEMYLGFIFDGFPTYNNISKSLPNITLNFVPIRASFNANCYMDFVTNKMDTIILKGTELTYGCSKDDYRVLISDAPCEVTSLTDNELECRPPEDEPPIGGESSFCESTPDPHPVMVTVGGKTQHACCVSYTTDYTDLIIGVTVTCVVVVAIIILVAVLLYKRHKKNHAVKNANYRSSVKSKEESDNYDSVVGLPNGNDDAVLTHDRSHVGAYHGKQTTAAMAMAQQRGHPTAVQPDHDDDYMQPKDIPAVFDNHGGMGDADIRGESSGRTHDSYANAGLYGHRGEQSVEDYGVAMRRQRDSAIDNNLMEVDPEIDY